MTLYLYLSFSSFLQVLQECDVAIVFASVRYCEVPSVWDLVKTLCESQIIVSAVNIDIPAHEWCMHVISSFFGFKNTINDVNEHMLVVALL